MSEQEHNRPGTPGPPSPAPHPPTPNPNPNPYGQGPAQGNRWGQQQPNPWAQQNPWAQPNPWGGAYPSPGSAPQPPAGYLPPPKPGIIPLRPLGLGEILDGAFRACRRSAGATFGSSLLIQAVITVVGIVLGFVFSDSFIEPTPYMSDAEAMSSALGIFSLFGWLTVGTVAGSLLIQGVMVIATGRAVLNLKTGFGQVWRILRPRLLPLAGLVLLMIAAPAVAFTALVFLFAALVSLLDTAGIVITVIGSVAAVAAIIWVSVKVTLAPAVIVQEGTGVFRSLARAWQVTRTNWWRVFGILLLTGLIVSVLMQVLSVPLTLVSGLAFGASGDPVLATVGVVVASAGTLLIAGVAYAFQSAVTTLVYVDLRMRREGFDVALMREQENPRIKDPVFLPGRAAPAQPGSSYPGAGAV